MNLQDWTLRFWEVVRGLSLEQWGLIISLLIGAGALYYARRAFRSGNDSVELSREQLRLAQEQASLVPRIELMELSLYPLDADPEMLESVQEARQEMEESQQQKRAEERARQYEERERRRREERQEKQEASSAESGKKLEDSGIPEVLRWFTDPPKVELGSSWKKYDVDLSKSFPPMNPASMLLHSPYEGPLPNCYIDVGIMNVGRTAAEHVTGWIELEKAVLQPIEYFASEGVEILIEDHGRTKVRLSVQNTNGLLHFSHNDQYTFRIPALLREARDTPIQYEFTSTRGVPSHGTFNMLLSSNERQE